MSLVVVYDACVLYPASLRDLLLRFAVEELCHARWSEEILDEVFGNLRMDRPDLQPERLERTRRMMCEAVPDCLVQDHTHLIDFLELPDPNDRHVLAAAIYSGAAVIVTDNLHDFPEEALRPFGIEAVSADAFALQVLKAWPERVAAVIRQQSADLKKPPFTLGQLIEKLDANGLKRFAAELLQRDSEAFEP
jgi:predicted nucleic acid-binding protein